MFNTGRLVSGGRSQSRARQSAVSAQGLCHLNGHYKDKRWDAHLTLRSVGSMSEVSVLRQSFSQTLQHVASGQLRYRHGGEVFRGGTHKV